MRAVWARTTVVLVTAACLLFQFIPVAPLRARQRLRRCRRGEQSVYTSGSGGSRSVSLSATPSVHVAWCVLVADRRDQGCPSRLALADPAAPQLTIAVVVATANHFWGRRVRPRRGVRRGVRLAARAGAHRVRRARRLRHSRGRTSPPPAG